MLSSYVLSFSFLSLIYFAPATAAPAATPTPSMVGTTFPPSFEPALAEDVLLFPLSILITSNSSPALLEILVSLSGADGVVSEILVPSSVVGGIIWSLLDVA